MCKGNGYRYEHLPDIPNKPLRQRMVVLSGAGISAESGLSTFRDTDGLWKNYNWERLASIDGFYEDPKAVLDFYNMRRKRLNEVAPNHTHKLLAELEKWHDVTIITQNVDNLHERAGSRNVIHLHGELTKVTSSEVIQSTLRNYHWIYPSTLATRLWMVHNSDLISCGLVSLSPISKRLLRL